MSMMSVSKKLEVLNALLKKGNGKVTVADLLANLKSDKEDLSASRAIRRVRSVVWQARHTKNIILEPIREKGHEIVAYMKLEKASVPTVKTENESVSAI